MVGESRGVALDERETGYLSTTASAGIGNMSRSDRDRCRGQREPARVHQIQAPRELVAAGVRRIWRTTKRSW